jgi:predicted nucleic acid-binding Zn ribbon protein
MQRITEQPLKRCPTCKSKVTKLVSSTAFQLKGSGWYVTDYARKGAGGEDKKAGEGTTKAPEGKESKAEAKGTSDAGGTKKAKGESAAA